MLPLLLARLRVLVPLLVPPLLLALLLLLALPTVKQVLPKSRLLCLGRPVQSGLAQQGRVGVWEPRTGEILRANLHVSL